VKPQLDFCSKSATNATVSGSPIIGQDKQALGSMLTITLIEAKLIRDTEVMGKMDPFVEIEYLDQIFRTEVINDGGDHPIWA
jgi:hypothetical protein